MSIDFVQLPGRPVRPDDLRGEKVRELARLLQSEQLSYVHLVQCLAVDGADREYVVLDINVEVGQRPVNPVMRVERIAVGFDVTDASLPQTLALRRGFPAVPHINLMAEEFPRSLCLYDEPYEDIKIGWTPTKFLARLSRWLSDTAEGVLHRGDQALEPLLMPDENNLLLIDPDVFGEEKAAHLVLVSKRTLQNDPKWHIEVVSHEDDPTKATHLLAVLPTPTQPHGVITRSPKTFFELSQFLSNVGTDLLSDWRRLLKAWRSEQDTVSADALLDRLEVLLLLVLPKSRYADREHETVEYRAFFCTDCNLKKIGEELGLWDTSFGGVGHIISGQGVADTKNGSGIPLRPAYCQFLIKGSELNALSGITQDEPSRIVAIGVGALGSQVVLNMARMGFGRWLLIDSDVLLPHNIGRHALLAHDIGKWKSISLANMASLITHEPDFARGIAADAHTMADEDASTFRSGVLESDIILDMSTSIAVARWLANDLESTARRASVFLSPSGNDMVLLAEDGDRRIPLDVLEMQYYRHLAQHPDQYGCHLSTGDTVRYGNSCRDISVQIPQDSIALYAAMASKAIRAILSDNTPKIVVWRSIDEWSTVRSEQVAPCEPIRFEAGHWTVITDSYVVGKAYRLRSEKAPNETGGILIGSFDALRRILYIVDILPAPSDSTETPTSFKRGTEGLKAHRDVITKVTAGWLDYVGEWHSHPKGCGCTRSPDDCTQCVWIAEHMRIDGLPGLMMIVGEGQSMFYVETV